MEQKNLFMNMVQNPMPFCNTDVITKIKNTFFHTARINSFSRYTFL